MGLRTHFPHWCDVDDTGQVGYGWRKEKSGWFPHLAHLHWQCAPRPASESEGMPAGSREEKSLLKGLFVVWPGPL